MRRFFQILLHFTFILFTSHFVMHMKRRNRGQKMQKRKSKELETMVGAEEQDDMLPGVVSFIFTSMQDCLRRAHAGVPAFVWLPTTKQSPQ